MRAARAAQGVCRTFTSTSSMQAVIVRSGKPHVASVPKPAPSPGHRVMRVLAAGVNRADLLQAQGKYPPPPGASDVLGLEAAGVLDDGRKACALLSSGAFAEYALVPDYAVLSLSEKTVAALTPVQMAAIPEAFIAAYHILFQLGQFHDGQSVLIHAGGSGVGTALIQLARLVPGSHIIASAGSEEKLNFCKNLGAHTVINYKDEQQTISEKVMQSTAGKGVDLVLDCVGASAFRQNVKSIRTDGIWVLYGLLSGAKSPDINLAGLLTKRVKFLSTTLRSRSAEFKEKLIAEFSTQNAHHLESGTLRPVIAKTFNGLAAVEDAFQYMRDNLNVGKVVIKLGDAQCN